MGHEIMHWTYPYNYNKRDIVNEIDEYIKKKCWEEGSGGLYGSIRWIDETVYNSYNAAVEAINKMDRNNYDHLAVPYLELPHGTTSKKLEALKEKIRETYKQYNSLNGEIVVKSFKAQYVACKNCGSKLNKDHLNSNFCPLCRNDMRSESIQSKIKSLYQKWQNLQIELRKEEETLATKKGIKKWVVKFEYHL